eukprot:5852499-Pleurochrysis_carterae.AAC.5
MQKNQAHRVKTPTNELEVLCRLAVGAMLSAPCANTSSEAPPACRRRARARRRAARANSRLSLIYFYYAAQPVFY